jgi:hypothetical protein
VDPDLKRFAQACRRLVREWVRAHGHMPGLAVMLARDPRRPVEVGDLHRDALHVNDVRATIVEEIKAQRARFAAMCWPVTATLQAGEVGGRYAVAALGPDGSWMAWSVPVVDGELGAWETMVQADVPDWEFVYWALARVAREEASAG